MPWTIAKNTALVSDTNPNETITNYNLDISDIILYKVTIIYVTPKSIMAAPPLGMIITQTSLVSYGRIPPSTRWLQVFSTSSCSTHDSFFN